MSMKINSSVTSQIMDLKTSTPGVTRKEEIKTGFDNVKEYSKYLQEKYSYMNTGTTSMHGVPTTVNVSSAFLKKCMDNPEKAAFLEENLAAIPNCIKSAVNFTKTMPGSPTMTYCNISIDDKGNISMMSGCTNDPDGKIAKENAEKKAEKAKEAREKEEEIRAEQKKKEQQMAEIQAEESAKYKEYTVTFNGTSVKSITQIMMERAVSQNNSLFITSGFDLKL